MSDNKKSYDFLDGYSSAISAMGTSIDKLRKKSNGNILTCNECMDALEQVSGYAQDQWNQYMAAPEHQRDPMICVYALQMIVQNCGKEGST